VVSESRVIWAISVPILVFLGLSVLDLGQMYATDRQTDVRQTSDVRHYHRLMLPPRGRGIIMLRSIGFFMCNKGSRKFYYMFDTLWCMVFNCISACSHICTRGNVGLQIS